ncbi:MAG: NAD(P)/FAD-dependent oxidoreductase [Candidatus Bipolaricaulaceae bacterium]
MKVLGVDVLVVGGGAAGLAAAAASAWSGARTLLLERNSALGGALEQCIHPGFGVHRYDEELTGPEFSCRLRRELGESGAQVLTDATLLDLEPSGPRALVASPEGLAEVRAKAVVWAAGARERPFGALMIPGSRPAGVFTAGLAQRLVNLHGLLPGQRAVVLGSGGIGIIMARRLRLEGVEVAAVLEIRPFPGGLLRNVVQCLDDFGIPLLLQHTVAAVHGRGRLRGVTAVEVDAVGKALPGRRKFIPCDTLILSVGLIPEVRALAPFVHLDPVNPGAAAQRTASKRPSVAVRCRQRDCGLRPGGHCGRAGRMGRDVRRPVCRWPPAPGAGGALGAGGERGPAGPYCRVRR